MAGSVAPLLLGGLGARAADAEIAAVPLRRNVLQIVGAGGNVVVLESGESLAVIDSGAPESAAALAEFIRQAFTDRRVEMLFNTHWHPDHTGGNEALAAGAPIVAHENTRLWMSTEFYVDWEDRTYPPRPPGAQPTDTFYSFDPQPLQREIGDRVVEYAELTQAHTDGDIYVRFPDENVIVVGDVMAVGAYPTPDHATGGWIGGLVTAAEALLELADAETLLVPGTGPVQRRADLEVQLEMLTTLRERIENMMRKGRSAEEIVAEDLTADYDEVWGDPMQFVSNVYDGLWWGGRFRGAL